MKVINLFGAPGAGKSTTAAGLFFLMKTHGYEVELVHEYAKLLTWSGRQAELADPYYVFAKQNHALHVLKDKVDYVVTDSPILLAAAYTPDTEEYQLFKTSIWECHEQYDNINFYIERARPYNPNGRNQTEEESLVLAKYILQMLDYQDYEHVIGDEKAPA